MVLLLCSGVFIEESCDVIGMEFPKGSGFVTLGSWVMVFLVTVFSSSDNNRCKT